MEGALFLVAIAAAIGLVIWSRYYFKKKRQEGLTKLAASLGFQYSPEDPFSMLGLPFKLFGMGDGRGAENVLWGAWHGMELKELDYWYYDESSDSKGRSNRTYHRFNCVVTELPLDAAPITIGHENFLTRIGDHLGFRDVEFESEDFNRAFQVQCDDTKFATDLIDARMMQWLLESGKWSFELSGPYLMCYCDRRQPTELIPLLGLLQQFRDHIPRVTYELHGLPQTNDRVEAPEERTTP